MIHPFFIALEFLSRIPIPFKLRYDARIFGLSLIFFPIVGLLLGTLQSLAALAFQKYSIPPPLLAIVLIAINLLFTGGLHLDGVADSADGFGAGTNRERILAIMKDQRLGTFGAAAIALLLFSKLVIYQLIIERNEIRILLLSPALSRLFVAITIVIFPYAREAGTALPFSKSRSDIRIALGLLCMAVIFVLMDKLLLAFAFALWFVFQTYIQSKIGGYTGDTLGSLNEWLEAGIPFSYLCLRGAG